MLVNETGDDEASRRALIRVGLDNIAGSLQKGMPSWVDAGLDLARTTQLSTGEVVKRQAAALVVDVRSDKECSREDLEGARHLMFGDLSRRIAEPPRDRPIITVCGSGYRSSIAASLLAQHGISVSSMDGGIAAWNQQKLPTVKV